MVNADEIIKKYSNKLESELNSFSTRGENESQDYTHFKEDMVQKATGYERLANSVGNIIKIKVSEKDNIKYKKFLSDARLNVTPSQALTFSAMSMLIVFFGTIFIAIAAHFISKETSLSPAISSFIFLGMLASLFVFYYTYTLPQRLASSYRLKTSSQMVPAILYMVIYMKHTSNLERAIEFAAEHLEGPLGYDFKKIFYDIETGKYSNLKQALDDYLESWTDYAPEFVESFHLIESSLYEPSETRRVLILEKSLQIILDGIYEKMLRYSREIRSPLTNVYMLGIILPTLGLAMIPLASTLLADTIKWYHVFIAFNIIVPFFVFFLSSEVLLKRPGGSGDSSILELNPEYHKYISFGPWKKAFFIALPILLIGLIPFFFQISAFTNFLGIKSDYSLSEVGIGSSETTMLFDFRLINATTDSSGVKIPQGRTGPFGPLSMVLSLFIPLSIALFFSIAYKLKTQDLIKAREKTKILETEFANSLFQLGNRLGDGLPPEVAFTRVAESTNGQVTQQFFVTINQNIQNLGMSIERAIFDKKRGAIIYFPSSLIATSMRILVESAKKGLQVAARSLMSISDYLKNIKKINERLHDLLAEIVSDMKSNITFLAPLLSGIIVGLSAMIIAVLNKLQIAQSIAADTGSTNSFGAFNILSTLFNTQQMIPPYFLQISIGIYIIEVIFILSIALVTVDAGKDSLQEKFEISKNLRRGVLLYLITALISILVLTTLTNIAINF